MHGIIFFSYSFFLLVSLFDDNDEVPKIVEELEKLIDAKLYNPPNSKPFPEIQGPTDREDSQSPILEQPKREKVSRKCQIYENSYVNTRCVLLEQVHLVFIWH